ncbi:MAG TPA: hypothetical protein ACFE0H_06270 [Elainellaceae cyanobacterium]
MVKRLILAIGIISSASFMSAFWGVSHLLQNFYIARIGEQGDEQVAQSGNEGRSRQPVASTSSNSTSSNSTPLEPVRHSGNANHASVQHAAVADATAPVEADLAPADDNTSVEATLAPADETRSVQLSQTAYQNLMDIDLHQTHSDESFEVRPPGIQPINVEVNPQEVFRSEQAPDFVDQMP